MTVARSPSEDPAEAVVSTPTGSDAPSWQEYRAGAWVLNFSQPINYSDKVHTA